MTARAHGRRSRPARGAPAFRSAEAERQLALLASPPPPLRLARPATVGDGVAAPLRGAARRARSARPRGARRGADLEVRARFGGGDADVRRARRGARARARRRPGGARRRRSGRRRRRPGRRALRPRASRGWRWRGRSRRRSASRRRSSRGARHAMALDLILAALLDPRGLDAARLPKALLPFHLDGDAAAHRVRRAARRGGRLRCAAPTASARIRFHLAARRAASVSRRRSRARAPSSPPRGRAPPSRSPSSRRPPTRSPLDARRPAGASRRRPAAPAALGTRRAPRQPRRDRSGDLVAVKNIDNVLPRGRHARDRAVEARARRPAVELERRRRAAPTGRPLRVCGVVAERAASRAEDRSGSRTGTAVQSLQIVESSQVAMRTTRPSARSGARRRTSIRSTSSSRCATTGGAPHDLARFVDPPTSFVATEERGRPRAARATSARASGTARWPAGRRASSRCRPGRSRRSRACSTSRDPSTRAR